MKRISNGKIFLWILFMLFGLMLLPAPSDAAEMRGVTDKTIKLGVLSDLTGGTAAIGKSIADGYVTFFKALNDQGGINGRKVELLFEDSTHEMPPEIAAFRKLLYEKKPLTIITFGTPAQQALFPLYEQEHVPVFAATIAHMMVSPFKKWVFAAVTDYQDTMFLGIDYVLQKDKNARIGVAYVDNPYGQEGLNAAEERLKKYGKELAAKVVVTWSPVDATTEILALKKANVDYVFVQGVGATVAALLRDAKRHDYKATFLGTNQVMNSIGSVTERNPELAKDVIAVGPLREWHEDCPGLRKVKELYAKYSKDKNPPKLCGNFLQAWVQSMILTEAMKRCGNELTPERLRDEIEGIKNFDTGGITGPISFSPTSHAGNRSARLYKYNESAKVWDAFTDWMTVEN